MKIGMIGAVKTTEITLKLLVKHGFDVVGVLGYSSDKKEKTSGWSDLGKISYEHNIPYRDYLKINDTKNINWMKSKQPDLIFAVGFSQLLSDEWLNMTSLGCIGFHPTLLPKGRGRAPLAWIILQERAGAATFFLMGKGADDGPIFIQEPFDVEDNDDAGSIELKTGHAIEKALNKWLPSLKNGEWNPIPQDEIKASWYGKREPSDGVIDWNKSAEEIDRLIKASSIPHPGAYTFFKNKKIIIWKSQIEHHIPIKGVVGRILLIDNDRHLIQCGEGLIWIYDIEGIDKLSIGNKLGYNIEEEIFELKNKLL